MAEKEIKVRRKILPVVVGGVEVVTAEERRRLEELSGGIREDGEKIVRLMMGAVQKHFEMGKIISVCMDRIPLGKKERGGKSPADFIAGETGIPSRTITKAFKIYRMFKDCPELIENLTMRDATALIADRREGEKPERLAYTVPEGQLEFDDSDFAVAPLSGTHLEMFRLHADENTGKMYLIKKGFNVPVLAGILTVDPPADEIEKSAYRQLLEETQIAMEKYYSVVESRSSGAVK